jgi:hypothetical protein
MKCLFVLRKISSQTYYYIYNSFCRKRLLSVHCMLSEPWFINVGKPGWPWPRHIFIIWALSTCTQCIVLERFILHYRSAARWEALTGLEQETWDQTPHTTEPPASAAWDPFYSRFTEWVEWNMAEVRVRGCSQRPQSDEWLFYVLCDIMREPWPHLSSQSQQYGWYLFKWLISSYHRHPLQLLNLRDLFPLTCFMYLIQIMLQRMVKTDTDLSVHLSKSSHFMEFCLYRLLLQKTLTFQSLNVF